MRKLAEILCLACFWWNMLLAMVYANWRIGDPDHIKFDLITFAFGYWITQE